MALNAKVKGTREMQAAIAKAGVRAREAIAAALYQEAERVMAASKQEVAVGVDGVLRASGHVQPPKFTATGQEVTLGYGGAAKSYAAAVHEGRRPGKMPPSKALIPWVRKKLGVPEDEAAGVAFVIAKNIWANGTKPTKYLERPLMDAIPGMAGRMAARIRRMIERR